MECSLQAKGDFGLQMNYAFVASIYRHFPSCKTNYELLNLSPPPLASSALHKQERKKSTDS